MRTKNSNAFLVLGLALLTQVALFSVALCAQTETISGVTNGMTPPGIAPGSPAGSYALSGFDTVNLFNGHLNFRLPLLTVGGRGEARYTMNLEMERSWRVREHRDANGNDTGQYFAESNLTPGAHWW